MLIDVLRSSCIDVGCERSRHKQLSRGVRPMANAYTLTPSFSRGAIAGSTKRGDLRIR